MVRKQLYITDAHDAELKARVGTTGITEAEIVREALDAAFGFGTRQTAAQAAALLDFTRVAEEFRSLKRPRSSKVYDRASLYQRFRVTPTY